MIKTLIAGILFASCLAGASLSAENTGALYVMAGPDYKVLTNQNTNGYFNQGTPSSVQGYPNGVVHLGLQIERWAALEASADFGPYQNYNVNYDNGVLSGQQVNTHWGVSTYSLMPAVTWCGLGWVNLLGFRVGLANLYNQTNSSLAAASYTQQAQTLDYGLLFRTTYIVMDHISVGLELGYDWTKFNNVRDVSGNASGLDYSGYHAALVFGLWSNPPPLRDQVSGSDD